MRRGLGEARRESLHAIADWLIHFDLVFFREGQECGRGEHLGGRTKSKQHLRLHRCVSLNIRNAKCFLIDDLIATHNSDYCTGSVLLFQFRRN
jgi:phosphoribosylpyrophosphate synthetase